MEKEYEFSRVSSLQKENYPNEGNTIPLVRRIPKGSHDVTSLFLKVCIFFNLL